MDARSLIFKILSTFDRHPSNLERLVDTALRDANIDNRDKRFIFEIVYGVVRHRLSLDYVIDRLLETAALKGNEHLRRILRMGLYQILHMDRVPPHAAVNESVKLAKAQQETKSLSGVVNGVLRKVVADRRVASLHQCQGDLTERLSIEYSHPRWMVERWLAHFGLGSTKRLLAYNNERPEIFLRRKIRGVSRQEFETEVRTLCDQATGYQNLYYRLKKNMPIEAINVVRHGLCNVQAPSSGWVVAMMEAVKGEKILDLCASPGGKTAILSEQVGDEGALCACDNRLGRVRMCVDTVKRMRLDNVYSLVCDGAYPPFDGSFDKVLLDAPCSSTGVVQRHPDARWTRTPSDIVQLSVVQSRLLEAAAGLVAPGGILVYATCSLEPEENVEQIKKFLGVHPEFEHTGCPDTVPAAYVDADGFLTITPFAHTMDGMFAARLKRVR
jgi:16S rRNA (cytosine967-C5)-methyltransferase